MSKHDMHTCIMTRSYIHTWCMPGMHVWCVCQARMFATDQSPPLQSKQLTLHANNLRSVDGTPQNSAASRVDIRRESIAGRRQWIQPACCRCLGWPRESGQVDRVCVRVLLWQCVLPRHATNDVILWRQGAFDSARVGATEASAWLAKN